jgi:hypothetical protein
VTASLTVSVLSVGLSMLAGWLVPAWAMKRLVPALESGGKSVTNFRGRSVAQGLGIAWLVLAAGVAALQAIVNYVATAYVAPVPSAESWLTAILATPIMRIAPWLALLVFGAFAFGMVDDVFGDPSARGFRGHLSALAHGRVTTGAVKLFGIGCVSLLAGLSAMGYAVGGLMQAELAHPLWTLAAWACASLVIALSANLVNLTDLRPGRALKSYALLATVGIAIGAWATWAGGDTSPLATQLVWIGGVKLSLLALTLGPVLVVWRYDLGERAMLGDAGANAAGALAGFLLAWRSPLWLLAVLVVVLLALNVASERVSFSEVIERVAFLRWLDGLGRLPADGPGLEAAHEGSYGVDAGEQGKTDTWKDGGSSHR